MSNWKQDYVAVLPLSDLLDGLLAWQVVLITSTNALAARTDATEWIATYKQEITNRVLEPGFVYLPESRRC